MFIKYGWNWNTASTAAATWCRTLIIKNNRQTSDTAPTAAEIFDVTNDLYSWINPAKRGHFTVLHDQTLQVHDGERTKFVEQTLDFKTPIKVSYNGPNSTDI